MPYRLENDETLTTGLRRCAREQLEKAIDRLDTGISEDPVAAVHDARKAIKRERAVLRLARGPMKPSQRRRENARLRTIARQLSSARDGDARLAALAAVNDHYAGQIPEATILAVRQRLSHDRDLARARLMHDEVPVRVADELRDALTRADRWKLRGEKWSALNAGLEREYRRGRQAMKRAVQAPTPERMHAWRKRSKDLWYQLRLLESLSPGTVGGQASDAHQLADQLGDLHDLAVLEAAVRHIQADLPADTDALIALIEHRAEQLSEEALRLGARVYAERPKAYMHRLHSYWRAWRAEARAAAAERPGRVAELTRHPAAA